MAGNRTFEFMRTNSGLDYEAAAKWGQNDFMPHEVILVLLSMLGTIIVLFLVFLPFIGLFAAIPAVVTPWFVSPKIIAHLKKNKPRSWFYDLLHRYGIPTVFAMPSTRQYHFRRAFSQRVFDGCRRLVKSPWVRPKAGGLVPTLPWHMTFGLPAIRIYDPKKKKFGRSLTPQPRLGGYAIYGHKYRPGAARVPDYRRNAVIERDENGVCSMEDYVPECQPWRFT